MNDETIDIRWSPAAKTRAAKILEAQPEGYGFRLRLKEAGCAGWNYAFDVAPGPKEGERRLKSAGFPLFVPEAQRELIAGTEIDFVQEGLNRVFRFRNPKAREVCGCGESFTLEEKEGSTSPAFTS
jgi:Fe-S cluster assembly protein SufA